MARDIAREEGVDIELTLLPGKVFEKVLQHARKTQPWLLILGRIGIHSQRDEMDLGSNTENLLRLAPCHVLLSSSMYVPPLDQRAEESVVWTDEAEARMERVPPLVKGIARTAILRFAMEGGNSVVTSDIIEQAMVAFMPGYTGKMMGKRPRCWPSTRFGKIPRLPISARRAVTPPSPRTRRKCPVCSAAADQFEVIDRQVVEAIAEAEGTTLEEAAFDGKKLKWSAEARRALRAVSDAYLRRRAKARIEKAARMQRLQTITRELALPMIDETVGSDRLDTNGVAEPVASAPADDNGTRPVPRPSEPLRTQPGVSDNPTLNWGDGDGNLNEVGAGRVMVSALPTHGEEDADQQN